MDSYISGGLAMLVLALVVAAGMQGFHVYNTARAVETAVGLMEAEMGINGCVTPAMEQELTRVLAEQGLDPDHLSIAGSDCVVPWGGTVTLQVAYDYRFRIFSGFLESRDGTLRIVRTRSTTSGVIPNN